MNHLTMEQLLALREPGLSPEAASARGHLEACPACQAELDRLHQRVARLKALPALRPPRDRWQVVRAEVEAGRRSRHRRWAGLAGLALAASVALAVAVDRPDESPDPIAAELSEAMTRSRQLENLLQSYNPDGRVMDGRTARIASELEDRIAGVDHQLQVMDLMDARPVRDEASLRLWRERVGLLDALVDVHVTRARNVGL